MPDRFDLELLNLIQADDSQTADQLAAHTRVALVEVLRPWTQRPGWWWVRSLAGPRLSNDGNFREFATVADTALTPMQPPLPLGGSELPALEQVALPYR